LKTLNSKGIPYKDAFFYGINSTAITSIAQSWKTGFLNEKQGVF